MINLPNPYGKMLNHALSMPCHRENLEFILGILYDSVTDPENPTTLHNGIIDVRCTAGQCLKFIPKRFTNEQVISACVTLIWLHQPKFSTHGTNRLKKIFSEYCIPFKCFTPIEWYQAKVDALSSEGDSK